MITEIKNLLAEIIKSNTPILNIAMLEKDAMQFQADRAYPFCSLTTLQGKIDNKGKNYRYLDKEAQRYKDCNIRCTRNNPIILKVFASNEQEADNFLSSIIPAIPLKWTYDNIEGDIVLGKEEHTDNIANLTDLYICAVEIIFTMQVGKPPVGLPTLKTIVQGE